MHISEKIFIGISITTALIVLVYLWYLGPLYNIPIGFLYLGSIYIAMFLGGFIGLMMQ